MAHRARMKDGRVQCSSCSAAIEPAASSCNDCGTSFEGDMDGMVCPYCSVILRRFSTECSNCGLRFKAVKPKATIPPALQEDEEFLKKLLEWGKQLRKDEPDTEEDVKESENAVAVFKEVTGIEQPTEVQRERLKSIEEGVREWQEFEKREESILMLAEPLEAALKSRRTSLLEAEKDLEELGKEYEALNAKQDPSVLKKRARIEKQIDQITREKEEIERLEKNLIELDDTYKSLLARHRHELEDKERDLQERVAAFETELGRRERERQRLEKKEALLAEREKGLEARIASIQDREREIDARERELKEQIGDLRNQKEAVIAGDSQVYEDAAKEGRWVVSPGDVEETMKKSKKAREEWLEEQRRVQQELMGLHKDAKVPAKQLSREATQEVGKLEQRIAELEAQLHRAETERASLAKEERDLLSVDEDVRKVLKVLDDLLANLPDELIDKFAKSPEFRLYEKVMDKYKV
ncbi:MAG: hypothetical protein HZB92_01605 [Euryarchaeota archaeon]|nr:hypothetical protein [Euryarchaeota archaeon]